LALFNFRKKDTSSLDLNSFIIKKFGYRPKRIELFKRALTHKSYSNTKGIESNERLEYLGDTVIDMIVAEYLYEKFPDKDEGFLTKVKAKIVNRKMLSSIGEELELEKFIKYKTGRSIRIATIEGNAFEALIGGSFILTQTTRSLKRFFRSRIIRNYIDLNEVLEQEIDFKSALLIWGQRNKHNISFKIVDEASKENNYQYTASVVIDEKKWGMGKGQSKKEAEQHASKETLGLLGV
jgi:ribonuclease-3